MNTAFFLFRIFYGILQKGKKEKSFDVHVCHQFLQYFNNQATLSIGLNNIVVSIKFSPLSLYDCILCAINCSYSMLI